MNSVKADGRSTRLRQQPNQLFNEYYKVDESTNRYMIEVGLDQYADIFSTWDPAPFKRRELDPDLKIYLEESSEEIPSRYPIELCFTLPASNHDQQLEEATRQGLHHSFNFKLYLLGKELKQINTRIIQFVVLGFILLGVGTLYSERTQNLLVLSTLMEGVFIAGWVFLWEAVSLFCFTNRELYHRYQTYRRLQKAPVFFREV